GMGFIEETGAAQYYRDARILPIYEGTTAIQANDLVGRKTLRDDGAVAQALLCEVERTIEALKQQDDRAFRSIAAQLEAGRRALGAVIAFVVEHGKRDPNAVFVGSVPYLKLAGLVLGGWQMARAALVAQAKRAEDPSFYAAKIATAQCFAEHVLPHAAALETAVLTAKNGEGLLALDLEQF
ncbi:MAG TPA: acyl-CoA dehydrogenase, partial [Trinickia sp.]